MPIKKKVTKGSTGSFLQNVKNKVLDSVSLVVRGRVRTNQKRLESLIERIADNVLDPVLELDGQNGQTKVTITSLTVDRLTIHISFEIEVVNSAGNRWGLFYVLNNDNKQSKAYSKASPPITPYAPTATIVGSISKGERGTKKKFSYVIPKGGRRPAVPGRNWTKVAAPLIKDDLETALRQMGFEKVSVQE